MSNLDKQALDRHITGNHGVECVVPECEAILQEDWKYCCVCGTHQEEYVHG